MLPDKEINIVTARKNSAFMFFSCVAFADAIIFLIKDIWFQKAFLVELDIVNLLATGFIVFYLRRKKQVSPSFFFGNMILSSLIQFLYIMYIRIDIMTLFFLMMLIFVVVFSDSKTKIITITATVLLFGLMMGWYFFVNYNPFAGQDIDPHLYNITRIIFLVQLPFITLLGTYVTSLNTKLLMQHQDMISESSKLYDPVKDNIDIEKQTTLKALANKDMDAFYSEFAETYPVFIRKVQEQSLNLVVEEMKVIALLYFNYSTKEIATKTNSTFRAIDAKKYRIRKKLRITTEKDISVFLHNL